MPGTPVAEVPWVATGLPRLLGLLVLISTAAGSGMGHLCGWTRLNMIYLTVKYCTEWKRGWIAHKVFSST